MSLPAGPARLPAPAAALIVLDGWGLAPAGPGNAVSLARTPVFDELWRCYPHTRLTACGESVGLPEGQMGNSEVGHLNLGAGAVVRQDLTRIDEAVTDGSLRDNPVVAETFAGAGAPRGEGDAGPGAPRGDGDGDAGARAPRDGDAAARVHLIGLVSDGGVHSGWRHLRALIELAGARGVRDLVLHAFTDGRDTLPTAGAGYLEAVEGWMRDAGAGRVGSVVGRYFAMDRDSRWERTQLAYDLLVHGRASHEAATGAEAVRGAYERDETDEFVTPTRVGGEATIRPGDAVFALNFRPDRMRQITRALAEPDFAEVRRRGAPPVRRYATMTEYEEGWPYPVAFPPQRLAATLAGVLADRGERQLHVAETEKYAHVTYFFNGGDEQPHPGERRELVPSPRDVPTYDRRPAMSARAAADAFVDAWAADRPRFAIINFANPDMVGHTGVIPAAVEAIETVDACLGDVVRAVHGGGGVCVVTADHGNADHMLEPDGSPSTAHSLNPVPLLVTSPAAGLAGEGVLADVAPTVLALLGIQRPPAMTGRSLLA